MSEALAPFLDRVGGIRRVQMILVTLGAGGVVWGFATWAMSPSWIPVGRNVPMETVGQMTATLTAQGIEHRLEAGGSTVAVRESDIATARVALAGAGFSAESSGPGFELFDQPGWGMTDFQQRVHYRRALEGELERTIGNMRGVESAEVHLALEESSVVRSESRPAEASVVIALYSGMPSDPAVVDGIASLVAASVEGLDKTNVMVLDDAGRLLSDEGDVAAGLGLSRKQLELRQQTERYLEGKAEQMLARLVGPGNSSVRVAAEMNFDQTNTTTDRLDPDALVAVSESTEEIRPGEGQVGAGQTISQTQYETTRTRETFQSGGSRIERLSVAVLVSDRRIEADDGTVTWEPRSVEELQRIEALVRNAVGIADDRSDEISIASVPFEDTLLDAPVEPETLDWIGLAQTFSRPLIGLVGLIVALVLALRLMNTLKETAPARAPALAAPAAAGLPQAPVEEAVATPQPQYISEPQVPTVQLQNPAMTARVLKAWMKEA